MRYIVNILPKAQDNLGEIYDYIAQDNVDIAVTFVSELQQQTIQFL